MLISRINRRLISSLARMSSPAIKKWIVTTPYLDLHCGLGEAPYYEKASNTLRFVDIKKKQLHTVNLTHGPTSLTTLQLDMPVGVTADIEGVDPAKKILAGGKHGVCILDRETGKYELLKRFYDSEENDARLRSNDGAIDPQGRFWIGTMNDFWVGEPQAEGTLFRFNSDLSRHPMRPALTIPNGLGWSRDQKTLYFTHSTEKRIIAFDYDAATGDITNERVFWQHDGDGDPDGFKMDEEGSIWQAVYGEGKVLKIDTEGKIVGVVEYPAKCITCPVFIGTELWVTSAGGGGSEEEVGKFAGAVFKVDVGVRGLANFEFKLEKEREG